MDDAVVEVGGSGTAAIAAIQIKFVATHVVVGTKIGFSKAVVGLPNFYNVSAAWVQIETERPLNGWVLVADDGRLVDNGAVFFDFKVRIGVLI